MADPIAVTIYDVNGIPVAGLLPVFTSPGYYKTAAGVDAVAPTVTDGGDGDYVFTPTATDLITGIRYLLDGGVSATPRFYAGSIESAASAQPVTSVSITGVNLFGVTPDLVKKRHFPQWNAFTTNTNPSNATVLEMIDEAAGELEARLLQEAIVATGLVVSNAAAYLWCRKAIRLMTAIEVLSVATQQVPPLSNRWQGQLDKMWKDLDEKGYLALGSGVSSPSTQPDGPTHFIDTLSLDTSDNDDNASSINFPFHKDDEL